jgi:hypothetical protein
MENRVTLGRVRWIGTSNFTAKILEKSHLGRDVTSRPSANQPAVHRYHQQGLLGQSLRTRARGSRGFPSLSTVRERDARDFDRPIRVLWAKRGIVERLKRYGPGTKSSSRWPTPGFASAAWR